MVARFPDSECSGAVGGDSVVDKGGQGEALTEMEEIRLDLLPNRVLEALGSDDLGNSGEVVLAVKLWGVGVRSSSDWMTRGLVQRPGSSRQWWFRWALLHAMEVLIWLLRPVSASQGEVGGELPVSSKQVETIVGPQVSGRGMVVGGRISGHRTVVGQAGLGASDSSIIKLTYDPPVCVDGYTFVDFVDDDLMDDEWRTCLGVCVEVDAERPVYRKLGVQFTRSSRWRHGLWYNLRVEDNMERGGDSMRLPDMGRDVEVSVSNMLERLRRQEMESSSPAEKVEEERPEAMCLPPRRARGVEVEAAGLEDDIGACCDLHVFVLVSVVDDLRLLWIQFLFDPTIRAVHELRADLCFAIR
ncbi:hypothetical protein Dimus_012452 [Dionaea muscipula]